MSVGSAILCGLFCAVCIGLSAGSSDAQPDVTDKVEVLGNPYADRYPSGEAIYARNIWDLHVHHGRLYIGAGNNSNLGPARNAGPVPIYSYDPASGEFECDFTVDDEQVDVFYTFGDGQLYTPGHDPRESWELGNFYRREPDGQWHKHRNIPNGIHTYAMAWYDGKLFGGLGTPEGSAVVVSKDNGRTWAVVGRGENGRVHSFLQCGGRLYAVEAIPDKGRGAGSPEPDRTVPSCVSEYDGLDKFMPRGDLTSTVLFPDTDLGPLYETKIIRPAAVQASAVYIGAHCHNDHQSLPFGVYVASSLRLGSVNIRRWAIPDSARPWDLIVREGIVYVLVDKPEEMGTSVRVLASKDLEHWSEQFRFHSPTFARSFELLDGDFYFGLGCEVNDEKKWSQEELNPDTGNILRLKGKWLRASGS